MKENMNELLYYVRRLEEKYGSSELEVAKWDKKDPDFIKMRNISKGLFIRKDGKRRIYNDAQIAYLDNYIYEYCLKGWMPKTIAEHFNKYNKRAKYWPKLTNRYVQGRKRRLTEAGKLTRKKELDENTKA